MTVGPIRKTAVLRRFLFDMRNCLDLTDRVAVVMGATSGIGCALAKGLADHGAIAAPSGRRKDRLAEVCRDIETAVRPTLCQTADVQDRSSIDALRDAVLAKFGRVDILVNAAGNTFRQPTANTSEEQWSALMDLCVFVFDYEWPGRGSL